MGSLLTRLLMAVAIGLLPALGFHAYAEFNARLVRQQLIEEEALRLVHLVSSEQQRIIDGAKQVLGVISGAPSVQDGVPDYCQRLLANLLKDTPRYLNAAVIGLDGRITCTAAPGKIGLDLSDRDYVREALNKDGPAISDYTIGRIDGSAMIAIAKRFNNRDGAIAGVVEVSVNLQWFGQQLEQLQLPPGATAAVADRHGVLLAHNPDSAQYAGRPIPAENRFTLEGDKIALTTSFRALNGQRLTLAYLPPGAQPNGLGVAVGFDPDIAFAEITRANDTGLWLIGAGAGLSLALTGLIGNRIIRRPFQRLLTAASSWGAGSLAVRTHMLRDGSEFGRLGGALDDMAEALEVREQRLRQEVRARQEAQSRAEQAERLQALGQLAGGIAHDFNNVLQALSSALSVMTQRAEGQPGILQLCRMGTEAVARGASITNRLLVFGRRGNLQTESVDIPELLHGLQEILDHTLGAGIRVDVTLAGGLRPAKADRHQLETVLINLATNARDAMPRGGWLALSAEMETVPQGDAPHPDTPAAGRYVRLVVADTGTGMDPVTLARARAPFFTTKGVGKGTGLGLSMAQGFAGQSGGALRIESEPGQGTTVTLWLPLAEAVQPRGERRDGTRIVPAAMPGQGHILLVEDDAIIGKLIRCI